MEKFFTELMKLLLQARPFLAAAATMSLLLYIIRSFGGAQALSLNEAAWVYIIGGFSTLVLLFQEFEPTYAAFRKKQQERAEAKRKAEQRRVRALANVRAASPIHRWSLEYIKRFYPARSFSDHYHGELANMVDLCLIDYGDPAGMHANVTVYRVPDYIWDLINGPGWNATGVPVDARDPPWNRNMRV